MNIYLDIDDIIYDGQNVAPHADKFLQAILEKYPNSTYWLTSHDDATSSTTSHLEDKTKSLLDSIKLAKWNNLKTDVIDFDQDFLWFGTELWPEELNTLEKHEAIQNFILVDARNDPDILDGLAGVINRG